MRTCPRFVRWAERVLKVYAAQECSATAATAVGRCQTGGHTRIGGPVLSRPRLRRKPSASDELISRCVLQPARHTGRSRPYLSSQVSSFVNDVIAYSSGWDSLVPVLGMSACGKSRGLI